MNSILHLLRDFFSAISYFSLSLFTWLPFSLLYDSNELYYILLNTSYIHSLNRPYSYSWYWTGTSLEWRLMWGNIIKKRLRSYSRYWTGTSLEWRLVPGNIIKKRLMSYSWSYSLVFKYLKFIYLFTQILKY